eukprot:11163081-Lingulodinium_polyedra.AAC.1
MGAALLPAPAPAHRGLHGQRKLDAITVLAGLSDMWAVRRTWRMRLSDHATFVVRPARGRS